MNLFWGLKRQVASNTKFKYWLCGVGVIIVMSVLAAMPSISQNDFTGSKSVAAAQKNKDRGFNLSGGQGYVQMAAGANQGNSSAVQGSRPQVVPAVQTVVPASDDTQPINMAPVCARHIMYPKFSGCDRLLCPDTAANSCSGCGALLGACLIE